MHVLYDYLYGPPAKSTLAKKIEGSLLSNSILIFLGYGHNDLLGEYEIRKHNNITVKQLHSEVCAVNYCITRTDLKLVNYLYVNNDIPLLTSCAAVELCDYF